MTSGRINLAFVDVETTGLNPDEHDIWEAALVRVYADGRRDEWLWQLGVDVSRADPRALEVGRFHERRLHRDLLVAPHIFAAVFHKLLTEEDEGPWYLAGANPAFDAAFLSPLLRPRSEFPVPWHHRLLCVETYAAGLMGWPVPIGLRETAERLGVAYAADDRHTALGDALLAEAVYNHCLTVYRELDP